MEKLILDEELKTVDNDPVFQWMLENATIKQSTGSEFRKIYKPAKSDVNKIDAVITSLLGIQCIQLPVFK
jgi:phage terminase large subunit-like protein